MSDTRPPMIAGPMLRARRAGTRRLLSKGTAAAARNGGGPRGSRCAGAGEASASAAASAAAVQRLRGIFAWRVEGDVRGGWALRTAHDSAPPAVPAIGRAWPWIARRRPPAQIAPAFTRAFEADGSRDPPLPRLRRARKPRRPGVRVLPCAPGHRGVPELLR